MIFIQKQVCCTACADNVILLKLLRYLTLEGKKNAYFNAICQTCVGSIRSAAARRIEEGEGVFYLIAEIGIGVEGGGRKKQVVCTRHDFHNVSEPTVC